MNSHGRSGFGTAATFILAGLAAVGHSLPDVPAAPAASAVEVASSAFEVPQVQGPLIMEPFEPVTQRTTTVPQNSSMENLAILQTLSNPALTSLNVTGESGSSQQNEEAKLLASQMWSAPLECHIGAETSLELCTYTNASFAGRGLSIFARPAMAVRIGSMKAFQEPTGPEDMVDQASLPFVERELPGRGIGIIATRPINRGERLFSERPLYIAEKVVYDEMENESEKRIQLQADIVNNLPAVAKEQYTSLCAHLGGDRINDIFDTNSFALDFSADTGSTEYPGFLGVFPRISRANHDCRPNTHYYFDKETMSMRLHAVRTIYPGEEITATYIDVIQPQADRRKQIHDAWGFNCSCSSCTAPAEVRAASDDRVQQIIDLELRLSITKKIERDGPQMAELLISLYEQERIWGPRAFAHRAAALQYSSVGDIWKAIKYANLAYEGGLLYLGPANEGVQDMLDLVEDPESHWSWRLSLSKP